MEAKQPANNSSSSDEIDLGQLFQMIGKGFKSVFKAFLGVFVYVKKNALILLGLGVIGVAVGYGLNQIVTKRLKTEVIVKPNLETKNYLYDVVNEIQANIKAKDTSFFKSLGIDIANLQGSKIQIEPAFEKADNSDMENDLKYLELLQNFEDEGFISDVVRSEILNKSNLNHRITFLYKNPSAGNGFAKKVVDYINSNAYFNGLVKINRENAQERINRNLKLVDQIDELISKYSDQLSRVNNQSDLGRIVLDNEEKLDITGLLIQKNDLIKDIERKKLELQEQKEAISIINFGRPQQVQKSFFGKNIILLPSILIGLFFLVSIIKYLNRKAVEMQV